MDFVTPAPGRLSRSGSRTSARLLAAALMLSGTSASAGYFGLPIGRTADLGNGPDVTLEAGLTTGEIGEADYEHTGVRLNYRLDPTLTLFGDFGRSSVGKPDGTSIGFGLHYAVEGLLPDHDTSVRAAYGRTDIEGAGSGGRSATDCLIDNQIANNLFNSGPFLVPGVAGPPQEDCTETEGTGGSRGGNLDSLSVELVVSGRDSLSLDRNLLWYATTGVHRVDGPGGGETEIGIGGGLVMALTTGELYFAADMIDEIVMGLGFRYHVD